MSTRYVWGKYTLLKIFNPETVSQYSWYDQYAGTSNHLLGYCATGVEWDDVNGKANLTGTIVELRYSSTPPSYGSVNCKTYPYFSYTRTNATFVLYHAPGTVGNYWFPSASGKNNLIYVTESASSSAVKYSFTLYKPQNRKGTFLENVSDGSSGAYPSVSGGGVSGNYWYEYKGSDIIDPTDITYSANQLRPGDSLTVTINPRSNTYGGTISYLYQYQINGGNWIDIQTTTAASINFTIPANAKTIRFRVRAQDNMDFTSATYVTGAAVTLERLNLWIGVDGKARKGVELYVGVNGKARKVTAAYIGVNGKARRFL